LTCCVHFAFILSLNRKTELPVNFFEKMSSRCGHAGLSVVFGWETKKLPEEILALRADRCYTIPMTKPHIRRLNLAMSIGIVLHEALRQQSI
jgi:tRNA(Leu) C34 or U34 (ribose-2'-O)-methylase TrmL